ncbi:unnamed protein product [Amoebophrya sp. A120]|nr:unnamed protein product [Amoebophrya sp. A120]|eukprot:GSA120T00009910001.1
MRPAAFLGELFTLVTTDNYWENAKHERRNIQGRLDTRVSETKGQLADVTARIMAKNTEWEEQLKPLRVAVLNADGDLGPLSRKFQEMENQLAKDVKDYNAIVFGGTSDTNMENLRQLTESSWKDKRKLADTLGSLQYYLNQAKRLFDEMGKEEGAPPTSSFPEDYESAPHQLSGPAGGQGAS